MFFKKCTIRYLSCLLMVYLGIAQNRLDAQTNNFTYQLKLSSLSFAGDGIIRIRDDNNTLYYEAPHWVANNAKPVGYKSGVKPKVACLFKITGICNSNIYVKGHASNGMVFPPKLLRRDVNASTGVYDLAESNTPFTLGKVDYFEKYTITWYYAESLNSTRWVKIGESTNKMYVTKGQLLPVRLEDSPLPQDGPPAPLVNATFHTSLYLGCNYAKGETSNLGIVQKVYEHFKTAKVKSVETEKSLQYWGTNYGTPYSRQRDVIFLYHTNGLLKYGEGTCQGWATFFVDILRAQGIDQAKLMLIEWRAGGTLNQLAANLQADLRSNGYEARASNLNAHPAQFFVKNWNTETTFVPLGLPRNYSPGNIIASSDIDGVAGQNMDNPWSIFADHVVVSYENTIYDPSYGSIPIENNNIEKWKSVNIACLGTTVSIRERDNLTDRSYRAHLWLTPLKANDNMSFTEISY
jgi:hypothetical protein